MGWELDGHESSIQDPTQNNFSSFPVAVALEQFFFGSGFFTKGAVGRGKGSKDVVQGMQEDTTNVGKGDRRALSQGNNVINKDISSGQRGPPQMMGRPVRRERFTRTGTRDK